MQIITVTTCWRSLDDPSKCFQWSSNGVYLLLNVIYYYQANSAHSIISWSVLDFHLDSFIFHCWPVLFFFCLVVFFYVKCMKYNWNFYFALKIQYKYSTNSINILYEYKVLIYCLRLAVAVEITDTVTQQIQTKPKQSQTHRRQNLINMRKK